MIKIVKEYDWNYVLDSGIVLIPQDWTGECYTVDNKQYFPVFRCYPGDCHELKIIGFELSDFLAKKRSDISWFCD